MSGYGIAGPEKGGTLDHCPYCYMLRCNQASLGSLMGLPLLPIRVDPVVLEPVDTSQGADLY